MIHINWRVKRMKRLSNYNNHYYYHNNYNKLSEYETLDIQYKYYVYFYY